MVPYEDEKIEELKIEAASKAKGIYHFGDSLLMLPYNYEKFEIIKSDSIQNIPFVSMLPLPNFYSWLYDFPPAFIKKQLFIFLMQKRVIFDG